MTDHQIKALELRFQRQFILLCILVVTLIMGAYFGVVCLTERPTKPGEFGDLFGVCTCLFSGLAFCGLLYTLQIQKLELRITRDELIKTAEANRETALANKGSLVVQRLSTVIAGREAILNVLVGPNERVAKAILDNDTNHGEMISRYVEHIKNALNRLDEVKID